MSVKCWSCGKESDAPREWKYSYKREYCPECRKKHDEEYSHTVKQYVCLKSKIMVERAIKSLERQNINIYDYREAIDAVKEYSSEKPDKFMSSQEIIAAIILIDNEIAIKPQYKIKNYQVDFAIPSLKIILEIDGYMHNYSQLKDSKRDIDLRMVLGKEWEVVRIPTKYIDENAEMLVEAMKAVKAEKQKIRAQYSGTIPEWYSKQAKASYKKIFKNT